MCNRYNLIFNPQNSIIMKQLLTVFSFILLTFLISSCGCNIECADCETLDEENCECVFDLACQCSDGIQNGNETGIDCGGDCDECFECTTNNCILLSGDTSSSDPVTHKDWICVKLGDYPPEVEWIQKYYSNGRLVVTSEGNTYTGTWKFDNPNSPEEIIGTIDGEDDIFPLVELTADTLRMNHYISNYPMIFIPVQ